MSIPTSFGASSALRFARVGGAPRGAPALAAFLALLLVALAAPDALRAQEQFAITPVQGLAFGTLIPGEPRQVLPGEAVFRAEWMVEGSGRAYAVFSLPTELRAPSGHTIPLVFADGDGQVVRRNNVEPFDPNVGAVIHIPPGQARRGETVSIWLGGTAQPAFGQAAGDYEASITAIVTDTDT